MIKETKISSGQFFSILLLTRFLSLLTYSPIYSSGLNSTDFLVAGILGVLIISLSAIPIWLMYKKNSERSILDLAYEVSPIYSKVVSIFYIFAFLFYAFSTLSRLDLFAGVVIFPETDTRLFAILSVAVACYAAYLGLEALGRAGAISLFVFGVSFLFILITMMKKMDINNFSPMLFNGVSPVMKESWNIAARTIELAAMAVVMPRVSGKKSRGFFIWIVVLLSVIELIFFFVFGGLGDYAMTQLFPVHAIAVLSEFSVFQRLDVILTGVWILSAFIKMSFMLYLAADITRRTFKKSLKNVYIVVYGLAVIIADMLLSKNMDDFLVSTSSVLRSILFIVVVIVVPLLTLTLKRIKRRAT